MAKTLSVTTTPPSSSATPTPMIATIDGRAGSPCGEHADRHGEHDRNDRGENRERDGRLDTLKNQRRHRAIAEYRDAEIALQCIGEPERELLVKRQIETEFCADRL